MPRHDTSFATRPGTRVFASAVAFGACARRRHRTCAGATTRRRDCCGARTRMSVIASTVMSATLTAADVERIAALAHLDLTADETVLFTRQLADILHYAEQIQELDTSA